MPDNLDPKDVLERWRQRIKNGEVLQFWEIDAPMKVGRDTDGGLLIDCPCVHLFGIEEAGIGRFRITPTAMKGLFQVLSEIQSTQGMPSPTDSSRSVQ